jgi:hypothetical protein
VTGRLLSVKCVRDEPPVHWAKPAAVRQRLAGAIAALV